MSHRGDRYGKKYIQCNFIYKLSLQPWVSRCARGIVPWVHRDTRLATEPTVFTAVYVVHGLSLDTQKNTTIYNP